MYADSWFANQPELQTPQGTSLPWHDHIEMSLLSQTSLLTTVCLYSGPQVRPKMILTLTASIMLWSLANKVTKAVDSSASLGKWAGAVTKIEATNKLGNSLRTSA